MEEDLQPTNEPSQLPQNPTAQRFSRKKVIITILLVAAVLLAVAYFIMYRQSARQSQVQSTNPGTQQANAVSASAINGAALGIDTPTSNDSKAISEIGRTPAIIDDFVGWANTDGSPNPFPKDFSDSIINLHSMPMITWQPGQEISGDKTTSVLTTITSGKQDQYIKAWADAAKAENHTIYVRLMHEMNGGWYAWGAGVNGNTSTMYVAAFQHVVNIFHQEGAKNVQFIWCVATSAANDSSSSVSPVSNYFPGDGYVSWVAMDGYSRKPDQPKTFSQIFNSVYATLTSISHRPVMIPETATVENPSNPSAKADWITTSFLTTIPNDFPRVKAVLYFDSKGNGYTYQIDTSTTTLAAIKKVFADAYYQTPAPTTELSY